MTPQLSAEKRSKLVDRLEQMKVHELPELKPALQVRLPATRPSHRDVTCPSTPQPQLDPCEKFQSPRSFSRMLEYRRSALRVSSIHCAGTILPRPTVPGDEARNGQISIKEFLKRPPKTRAPPHRRFRTPRRHRNRPGRRPDPAPSGARAMGLPRDEAADIDDGREVARWLDNLSGIKPRKKPTVSQSQPASARGPPKSARARSSPRPVPPRRVRTSSTSNSCARPACRTAYSCTYDRSLLPRPHHVGAPDAVGDGDGTSASLATWPLCGVRGSGWKLGRMGQGAGGGGRHISSCGV